MTAYHTLQNSITADAADVMDNFYYYAQGSLVHCTVASAFLNGYINHIKGHQTSYNGFNITLLDSILASATTRFEVSWAYHTFGSLNLSNRYKLALYFPSCSTNTLTTYLLHMGYSTPAGFITTQAYSHIYVNASTTTISYGVNTLTSGYPFRFLTSSASRGGFALLDFTVSLGQTAWGSGVFGSYDSTLPLSIELMEAVGGGVNVTSLLVTAFGGTGSGTGTAINVPAGTRIIMWGADGPGAY